MGITNRCAGQTLGCRTVLVATVICLAAPMAFGAVADLTILKPDPQLARLSNSLPSTISLTNGTVYHGVRLLQIQPDGLLVAYQPAVGGAGLADLKFTRLPEPLRKQFDYDPLKASAFEQQQALALTVLARKLQRDEKTNALVAAEMRRTNMASCVFVKPAKPVIKYVYYDTHYRRPLELGRAISGTRPEFTCQADFTFRCDLDSQGRPLRCRAETVTITLGLVCITTLPMPPLGQSRLQEEGHQKLYEYYYKSAPSAAERIGKSMIGCSWRANATNIETAERQVGYVAQEQVQWKFQSQIEQPALAANRYYNWLTDYGYNHMVVEQAVQETMHKFPANGEP